MGDLVERYKRWLQNIGFDGRVTSPPMLVLGELERQAALIEEAREGFRAIVDGAMPRPLGQIYRQDKKRSKHDLCIHHVPMRDDCENCTAAFALATLAKLEGAATLTQPPQGV